MAACASCASAPGLQPFSTDGCSLFPDRALVGRADWCECCVAHDLAYWRGGTAQARKDADLALKSCVKQVTGDEALAELMFAGVRVGGGPYLPTPYRWAYGWPPGRNYEPLTADEQARADELEQAYRASKQDACCKRAPPAVPGD